ncbi:hypothetical protein [Cryobacterium tagatosivorans]|uniref:hypothetical protein n=1 Tax=Cryobacterium tagatosivorans TaxID=1259199 RepID=UPI003B96E10F
MERMSGVRLEGVVDGGIELVLDDDRDAERAVGAPHGTPCQRHGRALMGTATDDLVIGRAVLRGLGEKRRPRYLRHVSSGRNAEGADLNGGWRSEHEVGIGGWVAVDYLVGASEGSGGLVWPPKVVTQLALATEKHNHPCLFCAASASSCLLRLAQLSRVGRPALLWNDTGAAQATLDLVAQFGTEALVRRTGSVPVASFTTTKLRWLRDIPYSW